MTIAPLYAGLLGLWFLVLSVRVILGRVGPDKPGLGDGGDVGMLRRIRGHANFSEYVPLIVVLLGYLEFAQFPAWMLHCIGGGLLAGRVLHGLALSFSKEFVFGRSAGIVLTLLALLTVSTLCVLHGLGMA